jgi:protein gp37
MSAHTSIEWTENTWNPTTGCDRISPGCDNCYALTLAARLKAMGSAKYQSDGDPRTSGPGFGLAVHHSVITQPLWWRTPRLVFVNSMSDLGHARIPPTALARIFAVMALTRRHRYQVLSKRPGRLARLLTTEAFGHAISDQVTDLLGSRGWQRWQIDLGGDRLAGDSGLGDGWTVTGSWTDPDTRDHRRWIPPWPLPNVWLGTSIESDRYTARADQLRQTPAAVRFLSAEPLLGPLPSLDLTGIDWVIAGGESGPRHRPLDLDWVRDLRDRCADEQVAFFFKQVGGRTPKAGGRLLDGRTHDDMPAAGRGPGRGGDPVTTRARDSAVPVSRPDFLTIPHLGA